FIRSCTPPAIFLFHYPSPPEIYTLSLHDALPISSAISGSLPNAWPSNNTCWSTSAPAVAAWSTCSDRSMMKPRPRAVVATIALRSEEHTSELQSRENLVCRLLLEKKKKEQNYCNE